MLLSLDSCSMLNFRPNLILIIKNKISLLCSADNLEQQMSKLIDNQVVDVYMSPELVKLVKSSGSILELDIEKVNVFALGVILLQMLILVSEN